MKGLAFTYKSDQEITKAVLDLLEQQEWKEWKEVNWYGKDPLVKTNIPSGRFCNPSFDNWCPYCVGDNCLKYGKKLLTSNRMSMEFHGQLKNDFCRKQYPKGLDMTQLSILDIS